MRKTGNPSSTGKAQAKGSSAIGALPLCLGLISAATLPTAQAESPSATSESRNYSIAAQPLYSALSALAEQSGVQFVYNSELVKGIDSQGVSGQYSLETALKRLLAGSGISYRFGAGNTVTLEKTTGLGAAIGRDDAGGDGARDGSLRCNRSLRQKLQRHQQLDSD
jgi:iron complex outermembrane receptor protein